MSLWVDKHRPNNTSKLTFRKEQMKSLTNLVKESDFPHLLIYGPAGAGKKTRVHCLLQEIYGQGVDRLRLEKMTFTTPSNKKIAFSALGSNYHMEVNPSDVGIYDRVIVQELIKTVAQTHQLDSAGQKEFKVVVMLDVDRLTKDAQHALRRTMEKYIASCRLILCASNTSRIIPAILSRCLAIRMPAPSTAEVINILNDVSRKENFALPPAVAAQIAEKSDRNLRRALLMCQACASEATELSADYTVSLLDWQNFIIQTAHMMISEQTPRQMANIRERVYELIIHGIPSDLVFKGIVEQLTANCDMQLKTKVVELASLYEHRIHRGSKAVMHFEGFIANFMFIYKKFMEEMMHDDLDMDTD